MNTKIKTEIAIGIIWLVAILVGGAVWLNGRTLGEDKFSAVPVAAPSASSSRSAGDPADYISSELQKLKITPSGPANKQLQMQIPSTLSDANWGMKKAICEKGGYDLASYAGKTLTFTSFPISVAPGSEPLNAWVISSEDRVVCVYEASQEGSQSSMPGIFPVEKPR